MKKLILSLALGISFISCQSLLMRFVTKRDITKDVKTLYNKQKDQTIVFFPMSHIGKKGYYESAKKIIDSLRKDGYIIYYENVAITDNIDSLSRIKYRKKIRKFIGFNTILDTTNKSLPNHYKRYELQDYEKMGVYYDKDTLLDLGVNRIIDEYERRYGKIELNDCDLNTPLDVKYECDSDLKKNNFTVTNIIRDRYIIDEILKKKSKKIIMVYGKMHWFFIYAELRDNGFELIKGKVS